MNKLTRKEQFLPIDHPDTLPWRIREDHFETKEDFEEIWVDIVFGIKEIDRSGADLSTQLWDSKFMGKIIWDDQFDIADPET